MKPIEAHDAIRKICWRRPELKYKKWPEVNEAEKKYKFTTLLGYCYVASHAFSYLIPEAEVYTDEFKRHYWNVIDGEVWDLTKDQFGEKEFDYSIGRKVPKKSKPTLRVQEILNELEM